MPTFLMMGSMIAHANAFLRGGEALPTPGAFPGFEESYVEISLFWDRTRVHTDPSDWIRWLRDREATYARFAVSSQDFDKNMLGFGAYRWGIETDGSKGLTLWSVGSPPTREGISVAPGRAVRFFGNDFSPEAPRLRPTFEEAYRDLSILLDDILTFCQEQKLEYWPGYFEKSQKALNEEDPTLGESPNVFPAQGYRIEARRLFYASYFAYAFGGMGSWNDQRFSGETQARFTDLTNRLYWSLMSGLVASLDAYGSP